MNYLGIISEIIEILKIKEEFQLIKLINNGKLKGGTAGEILAIICSILKAYENKDYQTFALVEKQSKMLFKISKECGINPIANYDLLDELDR